MARTARVRFSESTLKKGELRKLTALRKSLTPAIADRAFAEWFEKYRTSGGSSSDKTADAVADALSQLVKSKKLNFPRGGYIVRRGRGRVIVEPRKSK